MASMIIDQLDTFGPRHCPQLTYRQAVAYTKRITRAHDENFSVVSWFLPRRMREDFRNVYAFCRWADDLGDHAPDTDRARELLAWWAQEIDRCYRGQPRHPVFVALDRTIRRHDIPRKPFEDLVDAFLQDQTVRRYDRWEQVLDYCTRSANPVGRLVLYLCGLRDEHRQGLSDDTCTALQLANFWQDVRRDILERNRVYIPGDVAAAHGLDIESMVKAVQLDDARPAPCGCGRGVLSPVINAVAGPSRETIRDLVDRTQPYFDRGRALWPLLPGDVRLDVQLFTLGGETVLKKIRALNYDTVVQRPRLGAVTKVSLVLRALAMKLAGFAVGEAKGAP